VRNLSVQLSLSQLAKTCGPSYYCLYSLFNNIRDKSKTASAWKRGVREGEERGEWEREGERKGEEMTQTLRAHMNKRNFKK
jgi:hypothetical protein